MSSNNSSKAQSLWERLITALRDHAESLVLAVIFAVLVRSFVFSAFRVQSEAMRPTLWQGDLVLGYRLPFGLAIPWSNQRLGGARVPGRGDLVVIHCPDADRLCLMRVVGLPGDRIEMTHQRLVINDIPCHYSSRGEGEEFIELDESYQDKSWPIRIAKSWQNESWPPQIVPPHAIFVLNDFRSEQRDSRKWGAVDSSALLAEPVYLLASFDWSVRRGLPRLRPGRFFTRLN